MQGNDAVEAVFVSMGNPHAVIFVDNVAGLWSWSGSGR